MTNSSNGTTSNLDPFSVVVVFATSLGAGGEVASIVGAYGLILVSAFGGAAWAASGLPGLTKGGTLLHIVMMVGLALIGTVPIAELLARLSGLEARWLFAPLAVLLAARPDWVLVAIGRWFSRRGVDIGSPTNKGPTP